MKFHVGRFVIIAGSLGMATMPLTAISLQAGADLQTAIDRLASDHPGDFRSIAASYPADKVIVELDDRIRNDPAFSPRERARRFAFQALLEVCDSNEHGIRLYTDPRQVQLYIEELGSAESIVIDEILRSIHLVDDQFVEKVVPAIESLLFDTHNSTMANAIQALGRIGPFAESSLPVLKKTLIDPQEVNSKITIDEVTKSIEDAIPEGWREEYERFMENPDDNEQWGLVTPEQLIARLRSGAALARLRIDISVLPSDIALYRTLDPQGQRAGAIALIGALIETKGVLDNTTSASVAAAEYLADFYSSDEARKWRMETIPAFASALTSESTTQEARRVWRTALLSLMEDSEPEFARAAASVLQQ